MSFYYEFPKERPNVIYVGHTFLAALIIVAGKGIRKEERIKYSGKKACALLLSPEGQKTTVPPEKVKSYLCEAGYTWDGSIALPDQSPQVVFVIEGDVELFRKIIEGFGKDGGLKSENGIPDFSLAQVDAETAFLKGIAMQKRREYYAKIGDSEFIEAISIY